MAKVLGSTSMLTELKSTYNLKLFTITTVSEMSKLYFLIFGRNLYLSLPGHVLRDLVGDIEELPPSRLERDLGLGVWGGELGRVVQEQEGGKPEVVHSVFHS